MATMPRRDVDKKPAHQRDPEAPRRGPRGLKVPEITAAFWILKLLTTAMGEAASDYLLSALDYLGLGIGVVGFIATLWIQFRTRRYRPAAY